MSASDRTRRSRLFLEIQRGPTSLQRVYSRSFLAPRFKNNDRATTELIEESQLLNASGIYVAANTLQMDTVTVCISLLTFCVNYLTFF